MTTKKEQGKKSIYRKGNRSYSRRYLMQRERPKSNPRSGKSILSIKEMRKMKNERKRKCRE